MDVSSVRTPPSVGTVTVGRTRTTCSPPVISQHGTDVAPLYFADPPMRRAYTWLSSENGLRG
jgi:hypothetical protein